MQYGRSLILVGLVAARAALGASFTVTMNSDFFSPAPANLTIQATASTASGA